MSASVFDRLHDKLQQAGITFTVLRHAPVFTSEEAAAVRGTSLAVRFAGAAGRSQTR